MGPARPTPTQQPALLPSLSALVGSASPEDKDSLGYGALTQNRRHGRGEVLTGCG